MKTKKGMTITAFAQKMNFSRRNIYAIFEKVSLDTAKLDKIGKTIAT